MEKDTCSLMLALLRAKMCYLVCFINILFFFFLELKSFSSERDLSHVNSRSHGSSFLKQLLSVFSQEKVLAEQWCILLNHDAVRSSITSYKQIEPILKNLEFALIS